ncbi:MAG TPA: hypothetical protein PLQ44_01490 [Candidatus Paceibacterota bacterium]|nr:hypothetical protein [Candidatus Paceibacterota bacterium]HPT40260.1 hypothetical protein [Candidatus Paceibacterota bacterium]
MIPLTEETIVVFRNRNDGEMKKVIDLLSENNAPFVQVFTHDDSFMLVPHMCHQIKKVKDMIEYIESWKEKKD